MKTRYDVPKIVVINNEVIAGAITDAGYSCKSADDPIGRLISAHGSKLSFSAFAALTYAISQKAHVPARDTYGDPVAVAIKHGEGCLICLPHPVDKAGFTLELLGSVLPEIAPGLFPHHSTRSWLHKDGYEFQEVNALAQQISEAKQRHEAQVAALNAQIETQRAEFSHLYEIQTESGEASQSVRRQQGIFAAGLTAKRRKDLTDS